MSLTSPTSIVLALSMHQYMVQHQVSLVHHYCDTFHAPQQSNINSHRLQQNNTKSTVGYRQIPTTRLGSLGQIMPAGYTLDTNSVVEPVQTNTHKITSISLGTGYELEVLTLRDSKLSKQLCFLFFFFKKIKLFWNCLKWTIIWYAAVTIDIYVIIFCWFVCLIVIDFENKFIVFFLYSFVHVSGASSLFP